MPQRITPYQLSINKLKTIQLALAEDTSASVLQELSTQLLLLQTLNQKLVKEKDAAETEAALLKAKPSFPNDFSNSLQAELKELFSKFNDIIGEVRELKKYVEKLEIELPWDLK
ncbi:hypothetical protein Tco_1035673 [Tanacetum coccineum]